MRPDALLDRIRGGHLANIRFDDLLRLAGALGFVQDRVRGSHIVLWHARVNARLVVQPGADGAAKPYQIRQLRDAIDEHGLALEARK